MVSRLLAVCGWFALCVAAACAARMTASDKTAVLNLHNQLRCNAPNSPIFMPVMYWDTDLEAIAQSFIDTCPAGDISNPPYLVGSNWAGSVAGTTTALQLAQQWANEQQAWTYDPSGAASCSQATCAHYTQMVWASSIRVGCATNTNSCSSMTSQLNCLYSPAGNVDSQVVPYPITGDVTGSALKNACPYTNVSSDFLTPYCSSPCQNGGVCSSFEYCRCAVGFSGPYCEYVTTSTGSFGLPSIHQFTLTCSKTSDCFGFGNCCDSYLGWGFGLTCNGLINAPSTWSASGSCPEPVCSTACQNGGTCVDTNLCACPLGFSGAQCQTSTGTTAPTSTTTTTRTTTTTTTTTSKTTTTTTPTPTTSTTRTTATPTSSTATTTAPTTTATPTTSTSTTTVTPSASATPTSTATPTTSTTTTTDITTTTTTGGSATNISTTTTTAPFTNSSSGGARLLTINAVPTYHPGDKIRIEFTGHGTSTGVQVCLIRVPSLQSPYCDVLVTDNAFLNYDLGFVDFVLPSDLPLGKYSLAAGFNLLTTTDWHNFAFEYHAFKVARA